MRQWYPSRFCPSTQPTSYSQRVAMVQCVAEPYLLFKIGGKLFRTAMSRGGFRWRAARIGTHESVRSKNSSHRAVNDTAAGRGIIASQDLGPGQVRIDLSANSSLRVSWTPAGIHIDLISAECLSENQIWFLNSSNSSR